MRKVARIESGAKCSRTRKPFEVLNIIVALRGTEKYVVFGLILLLMFPLSSFNIGGAQAGVIASGRTGNTQPTLLYIYADVCPYCQREKPVIDELEREYSGSIQVTRVNGPEEPQIMSQCGVQGFPSIYLLGTINGKQDVYSTFVGFTEKDSLKESLDGLIATVSNSGSSDQPSTQSLGVTPSTSPAQAEICDWQGCRAGAASISEDDSYSYILAKLNSHNLKGTFYLMDTQDFSQTDWAKWHAIYNEGHELGGHTQTHPCYELDDNSLRYELSSNKNDIINRLNIPPEEVSTMAWPCGFATIREEQIASEYFIAARGYSTNQLEDKNPSDFMDLKAIDSPNYDYSRSNVNLSVMADMAESQGKWVNYVFHDSANDDGVIDYLVSKNLWVAPVGNVSKYILERQNSSIDNLQGATSDVRFNFINNQDHALYNQELTLKVLIGERNVHSVTINNSSRPFTYLAGNNSRYVEFSLLPTGNDTVEIVTQATSPVCGNGILEPGEECDDGNLISGDGCSSDCKKEDIQVYLAPYMGDIDGDIDQDWFFLYDQLRQWHDANNIPVAISFYPNTMDNTPFDQIIANMYTSKNVELVTKGQESYDGNRPDLMSYYDVKGLIQGLQDTFVTNMEALGYDNVKAPVAFNLNQARFTDTIRDAVHDLGFKIYFEQYVSEYGNIDLLPDFDVMQYTVSFTTTGHAGPGEAYKPPAQIEQEIINFQGDHMLYINGVKVVSLMAHQQDFRTSETSSTVNQDKWNTYTSVLKWAKDNPKIRLITPEQIFDLRHPQKQICQYASSASANSEDSPVSLAAYATGAPDVPTAGNCSVWSGPGYTWTPSNWDVTATLTLTYKTPVYATHFIIYGDQDMCWHRIWLKNSATGQQLLVFEGFESLEGYGNDERCISTYTLSGSFTTDTIILETCGWSWSATDAVELCGNQVGSNVPAPTQIPTAIPTPTSSTIVKENSLNIWVIIGPILGVLLCGFLGYFISRCLRRKTQ